MNDKERLHESYFKAQLPANIHRTSEDVSSISNPYHAALAAGAYKNKRDADKLYNASLEIQAQEYLYKQQLADQDRLIDEQRAYDHPLAQRQRQLAAGVNPDLLSGSGVGSGSTASSVPAMPSSSLEEFTDPLQDASSVAGTVSSLVSSVSSFVGTVNSIANFGNVFTEMQSKAQSAKMAAFRDRLGLIGDIASMLPPETSKDGSLLPLTSDVAAAHLRSLGIDDPDNALSSGLVQYSKSPVQQQYYADSILKSRYSLGDLMAAPMEAVSRLSADEFKLQQLELDLDLLDASFLKIHDEYLKTESNALLLAGNEGQSALNESADLYNESKVLAHESDRIDRDIQVYGKKLGHLFSEYRRLQDELKHYSSLPDTPMTVAMRASIATSMKRLETRGSKELDMIYGIMRDHDVRSSAFGVLADDSYEMHIFKNEFYERYLSFIDIANRSSESATAGATVDPVSAFVDVLKSLIGRKGSKKK